MYMHYILHLNIKKKTRIMYCETCDIVKLLISASTEMTNAPEPSISCTIFVCLYLLFSMTNVNTLVMNSVI